MLKYSLVVLATVVIFSGCDSDCCAEKKAEVVNPAPVAKISGFGATCTPGEVLTVSGTTSTDDGSVASYAWTPASIAGANGTFNCPVAGSQEICLTVKDDEGKVSSQECKTVTVAAAVGPVAPTARITAGACDAPANDARYFSCETSSDNDVVNPNPDIGRTDTSIVKCDWTVKVYNLDGTLFADHGNTYTTFFADNAIDITYEADGITIAADSKSTAVSPKWVGHEAGYKIIELTVTDDDGQVSAPVIKKFDYTIGDCGDLVDP